MIKLFSFGKTATITQNRTMNPTLLVGMIGLFLINFLAFKHPKSLHDTTLINLFSLCKRVFHSFSNNRGFNLFAIRSSLFKPRGRVKICKKLSRFVTVVRHFYPDVQVQFARPLQPGQVKFNVFAIF